MAEKSREFIKPKKITSQKTYKYRIKKQMVGLNVYKPEFDMTIGILADQMFLYDKFMTEFEESDYELSTDSAAGTAKKSPTVAMLELLWKNILQYSDRLCINPKSLKMESDEKQESALEKALSGIE